MSNTVIVELTNQKAMKILLDLEELNVIKLISKPIEKSSVRDFAKFRNILTSEEAEDFQSHILEIRKEWNSI